MEQFRQVTIRVILAICTVSMLLVAACAGGGSGAAPDRTEPFIGGNGGLAMSFQEGLPPAEIFDNGNSFFSIGVKLENLGESDVGVNSDDFTGGTAVNPGFLTCATDIIADSIDALTTAAADECVDTGGTSHALDGGSQATALQALVNVGGGNSLDATEAQNNFLDTSNSLLATIAAAVGGAGMRNCLASCPTPNSSVQNAENGFMSINIIGIDSDQFKQGNATPVVRMVTDVAQLDGVECNATQGTSCRTDLKLLKARKNFDGTVIPGEIQILNFENYQFQTDLRGNSEVTIRAELCYDYTTYSTTKVCIKDNPLENALDDTICTLNGPKQPKNSGSPVQVTSVTQNPLGNNKIQVTFLVENVGEGTIYQRVQDVKANAERGCENTVSNPYRDWVEVDVSLNSGDIVRCSSFPGSSNAGEVRLNRGFPIPVVCSIEVQANGNRVFTDTLNIELKYKYGQFVETPLLIRDADIG